MSEDNGYQVLGLHAENFLNIKILDLTPPKKSILITGPNGSGKTNVIKIVVAGMEGFKNIPEPVLHGEKSGKIVLDLGDIIVTRTFTNETNKLVVENNKGLVYKSPQALLNGFRSKISFDPMGYDSLSEKKQMEVLLNLIDLPIDLDELARERSKIYGERTLVNRDITNYKGQLEGIPDRLQIPDEEKSTADIIENIKIATKQITENDKIRNDLDIHIEKRVGIKAKQDKINEEMLKLKDQAEHIKLDLARADQTIATMKDEVAELVDPDIEMFTCQMDDIETINAHVREKQERRRIFALIEETQEISKGMTKEMEAIDALKTKTIKEANMPVPGLGFNENGVTYDSGNGAGPIALKQRSSGEQHEISFRIGMATNPKLKVVWVPDASLLDKNRIEAMKALAEKYGYQLWLEIVDDSDNVGIVIREGKIVKNNYESEE